MKVWLISFGNIDFDGRLIELTKLAKLLGSTMLIC